MKIQMSLSTKCGANCRFCLSTVLKNRYKFTENIDMEMSIVKKIIDYSFDYYFICSNRGEALYHPDIDKIITYLKYKREKKPICFSTNASLKNIEWWKWLAEMFDDNDCLFFPLDGIGNITHNKHRKTDFYTVLKNIEAFVAAGGKARWKFIKFKHNQHQIELARSIAKEIGCEFDVMNSHTYDNVLQRPDSKIWDSKNIMNEEVGHDDYLPCNDEMYYVNTKGILFPCCFLANIFGNEPLKQNHQEKKFIELFDKEINFLNVMNTDIDEIIKKSKFFKSIKKKSILCKEICLKWTRNQLQ